jgi:hypothetical protein
MLAIAGRPMPVASRSINVTWRWSRPWRVAAVNLAVVCLLAQTAARHGARARPHPIDVHPIDVVAKSVVVKDGKAARPYAMTAEASGAASPTMPSAMMGTLGHPYNLPSASRARMHQCAIAWQRMKLEGTTGGSTWRVFATGCLTAVDNPPGDRATPGADKPNRSP